jgi:hypothetical protein
MDELTSPGGAVALAISALLLVVGYRLARPERGREWLAVAAYGAALAAQLLGARGLLPGPALSAGPALRIAGALLLVGGLLVAGGPSRAQRRAVRERRPGPPARSGAVYAGLGLVLAGQLARGPSSAGAIAAAAAMAVLAATAAAAQRDRPRAA